MPDIQITFPNWEKFNYRKDVSNPSWFRMSHSLFEHPDFEDFKPQHMGVLVYLLSIASKKSSNTFILRPSHAERIGKISQELLQETLNILIVNKIITIADVTSTIADGNERDVDVTSACSTNRQTDKQNIVHPKAERKSFNLEDAYQQYPRKQGKSPGMKRLKSQIKTQADFDDLKTAVTNYRNFASNQEPQYIKLFSTFASEWRDWIDPENGKTIKPFPTLVEKRLEDL